MMTQLHSLPPMTLWYGNGMMSFACQSWTCPTLSLPIPLLATFQTLHEALFFGALTIFNPLASNSLQGMLFMPTIQINSGPEPEIIPHALIAINALHLSMFSLLALTHALSIFGNVSSLGITHPFSHQRPVQSVYASSFITLKCFYTFATTTGSSMRFSLFSSLSQG